jgi:hypothetical protein
MRERERARRGIYRERERERRMNSLKWEKNWGNNVDYRPLDHKYKTIFKSKRNWEKLIDGW